MKKIWSDIFDSRKDTFTRYDFMWFPKLKGVQTFLELVWLFDQNSGQITYIAHTYSLNKLSLNFFDQFQIISTS